MQTERVREVIERVSTGGRSLFTGKIDLAPDTQQVLEYAVEEARQLGHHYIGTEHILLGLVRVEGKAMEVLRRLGVTPDQIRRQTRRVLNEGASTPAPAGPVQPQRPNSTRSSDGRTRSSASSRFWRAGRRTILL